MTITGVFLIYINKIVLTCKFLTVLSLIYNTLGIATNYSWLLL